ncbi:MAG: hypothetical protein AABZ53_14105 [Planctomycetota bacterium]
MKRSLRTSATRLGLLLAAGLACYVIADDTAPVAQPVGMHSSVVCSDGSWRDDELANIIAGCLILAGHGTPRVHDIKFMANCCYGGGLLDDLGRICGPGGPLAGTPWVGGSASGHDETAKGWVDGVVNDPNNAGKDLGSTWTDALGGKNTSPSDNSKGAIRNGSNGNVKRDLERARDKDAAGPNGLGLEHPQVASGNGGDGITWTGASSHHAVVFGGSQTDQRHHNNVNNMADALNGVWAGTPHTVQKIDGGTKQELVDAICAAAALCNENEQLVIYIDDHGDWELDIDEFLDQITPWFAVTPFSATVAIPPGYAEGVHAVAAQGDNPVPAVWLDLASPMTNAGQWSIVFNGAPHPLPIGLLQGRVSIPIAPSLIHTGINQFQIVKSGPPSQINLQGITLWSGSLNDLDLFTNFSLCPADFDGDGTVDFFDYDAFVQCFEGLTCPPGHDADFDYDGTVDFFDYDAFVVAFETPCD